MGISTLQFEHLIDGKKPEARSVFVMFVFHFFAKLRLVSRNALVSFVHNHAWIRVCSQPNAKEGQPAWSV